MAQSKRIFTISIIKNETDIIESFVRYNINIFDGMIILDNNSTDDTVKILKLLKSEGLPIFIFEDEDNEFNQALKMNKLLLKAIDEFNADVVVPLDADEFLISSTKENPKKILEKIEDNSFHQVKWKTYVPDFSNEKEKFIPAKITFARYGTEEMHKVILPKELVQNCGVRLNKGNHSLRYDKKYKDVLKQVFNTDLRIAHFPMRSKEQALSKIAVSWINNLCDIRRTEIQSWHFQKMFNELKENGKLEDEDIINFAKVYSSHTEMKEITLEQSPIDLTFCKNIEIKYTNDEIKPIADILNKCEELSLDYLNFKKRALAEEKELKTQIKSIKKEEKRLKNKIKEYHNSTSWRITSPLRKISNMLRNSRN